ncbi:hypothetical protein LCGC14_2550030 [marine sediment metagenome]|uniref:ABC transporter domain-containing protein n=1 Tax=marine sediment metagenome TaxID=412755 RepID=A0A0F9BB10_9ZZZZ
MIRVENVSKSFTLHNQGAAVIPVMRGGELTVARGECVALTGASGAGKSTLMRMIYGNYLTASGRVMVGDLDVARAAPREILDLRRNVLGYVSQFLRVVPRVATLDVVAEPLRAVGSSEADARARAGALLAQLNIPERLWQLSPTTFSGGEQQRVAFCRALANEPRLLLADEPTGNLDPSTSDQVFAALMALVRGTGLSAVIATHNLELAARMDRQIRLEAGQLVPV